MAADLKHLDVAPGQVVGIPMGLIPGGPGGMAEFSAAWRERVLQNAPAGYLAYGSAMNMARSTGRSRTPRRDAAQLELNIQRASLGVR